MTSQQLKPSQELLEKIAMVKDSLTTAGEMIKDAYNLAIRDGFSPKQAREFLTLQLPFLAERTIRLALPDEAKDQSKVRHSMPQKPLAKTINVSTEHKVIDVEPEHRDQVITQTQENSTDQNYIALTEDEEPSELELANIKIAQLEDALHKTQQFKPANALQEDDINTVTLRAGIGAIGNMVRLEIPKLENRGWKVVEVKMRAV